MKRSLQIGNQKPAQSSETGIKVCPMCQKPANPDFTPFCSKNCKNIDLLHWLKEDYSVPGEQPEKEKEDDIP